MSCDKSVRCLIKKINKSDVATSTTAVFAAWLPSCTEKHGKMKAELTFLHLIIAASFLHLKHDESFSASDQSNAQGNNAC